MITVKRQDPPQPVVLDVGGRAPGTYAAPPEPTCGWLAQVMVRGMAACTVVRS
jgi:hypothetical protein